MKSETLLSFVFMWSFYEKLENLYAVKMITPILQEGKALYIGKLQIQLIHKRGEMSYLLFHLEFKAELLILENRTKIMLFK